MKTKLSFIILMIIVTVAMTGCATQQTIRENKDESSVQNTAANTNNSAKSHHGHDAHLADVNERGDKAMGFSHQKTTHHFRLLATGGAIEVTANDSMDEVSREQIRTHLRHISQMFAAGNFEAPMLTHGKTPDGVPAMQKLKAEINYQFEELPNGGRVRISTKNEEALGAVQQFLRFQILDHQTGDSLDIQEL